MSRNSIVTCGMAVFWLACCSDPLPVEVGSCPCGEGQKCCEETQLCVEEGEPCKTADDNSSKDDVKNPRRGDRDAAVSDAQTEEPSVEPVDNGPGSKPAFSDDCGLEYCIPCSLDCLLCDPVKNVCVECTKDEDCEDHIANGEYCDVEDGLCKGERGSDCWADWQCHHDEICVPREAPFTGARCEPLPQGTNRTCSLSSVTRDATPPTDMSCKDGDAARRCVRSGKGASSVNNSVDEQPCGVGMECVNLIRTEMFDPTFFNPAYLLAGQCRTKQACATDDDCSSSAVLDDDPEAPVDPRLFCHDNWCIAHQTYCSSDDECPAAFPACGGIGLCVNQQTECVKASDCASLDPAAVCAPSSWKSECGVALKAQGG